MNEPILLGIGILIFLFVWRPMLRRTALDHYRDKLFDLRESVREHYLSSGKGLADPTYGELRALINSQIGFLKDITFTRLVFFQGELKRRKEVRSILKDKMNSRFETDDPELRDYIKRVRQTAYNHTTGYVIHSSAFLFLFVYSLVPFALIALALKGSVASSAATKLGQKVVSRDIVEDLAVSDNRPCFIPRPALP